MPTATVAAPTPAPAKQAVHQPKQLPPPNSDFYDSLTSCPMRKKATVKKVRTYMETKVKPVINKYWADGAFPFELLTSFKNLGIAGLGYEGYGCPAAARSCSVSSHVWRGLTRQCAPFLTGLKDHEHTEDRLMSCGRTCPGIDLRVVDE